MDKKAYLRTLEAALGIIILFLFFMAVKPEKQIKEEISPEQIQLIQETILKGVEFDENLRDCVLKTDEDCIKSFTNTVIPSQFEHALTFCDPSPSVTCEVPEDLPEKNIYSKDIIISSTITQSEPKILRLYIWEK